MNLQIPKDDDFPSSCENENFTIAIIGCGGIVRDAHLPAYRQAAYDVRICCDSSATAARETAAAFAIAHWTTNLQDVLDSEADIIDLNSPIAERREIIAQICKSDRKPRAILIQKPFAPSLEDARAMVEMCDAANIVLMVNQHERFTAAHRALKKVIDSGELGHVYSIVHFLRSWQDEADAQSAKTPHFNLLERGMDWIDLTRFFSGQNPVRAKATTAMVPGQNAVSPLIYSATLEYETNALMSTLHFNNIVATNAGTGHNEWLIDGTLGTAILAGGALTFVSSQTPLTKIVMKIASQKNSDYACSMGELMRALDEKREPMCSGRDNLHSLRIVLAMLRSSENGDGTI